MKIKGSCEYQNRLTVFLIMLLIGGCLVLCMLAGHPMCNQWTVGWAPYLQPESSALAAISSNYALIVVIIILWKMIVNSHEVSSSCTFCATSFWIEVSFDLILSIPLFFKAKH
uniref:Uncharacterized protein n=1 Tax=Cacopsylla melanoneura TaxID=428564 RepID=A0A8D8SCK6_9HEMI